MEYNPYHHLIHPGTVNMPLLHAAAAVSHMQHPGSLHSGYLPLQPPIGFGFVNVPQDPLPSQGLGASEEQQQNKRRKRGGEQTQREPAGQPQKRRRAKKPLDAPTRPKSAYMFFLAEFRERWKVDNPKQRKVADVAQAAGDAWRSMDPEQKAVYEDLSNSAKADYAISIAEYEREHPKPARHVKPERDPSELKRPQSAYLIFLADFRAEYKEQHPGERPTAKLMGCLAGARWQAMSAAERAPYDELSRQSKAEYARMKKLTPEERVMVSAAAAMSSGQLGNSAPALPSLEHGGPSMAEGLPEEQVMVSAAGALSPGAAELAHGMTCLRHTQPSLGPSLGHGGSDQGCSSTPHSAMTGELAVDEQYNNECANSLPNTNFQFEDVLHPGEPQY